MEQNMDKETDLNASTATVDEITSDPQPVASSTPENEPRFPSPGRILRPRPVKAPSTDYQAGAYVRCFTNITGRRPIHSPSRESRNRMRRSRGSSINTRKSRSKSNRKSNPELPSTSRGINIELNVESPLKLPKKEKPNKSIVLVSCAPRLFGPVTRRQSLLGFAIAAAKRKIEDCGEISLTVSDPGIHTVPDLRESPSKRVRIDNTLQIATVEKPSLDVENKQETLNSLGENELNVTSADTAAVSEETELRDSISEVNGILNSISLISQDEIRAEATVSSTQIEDCSMKKVTPETSRISNSLENFSTEQNLPLTNEQSTPVKSCLIKDTITAANKMPNFMREYRMKENNSQNNLQIKENNSSQKEDCAMEKVTPGTSRISYSLEDFNREQNLPQTNEQSTPVTSCLIKPTITVVNKMPNLMRKYGMKENNSQNNLQLKENTKDTKEISTPKEEVTTSEVKDSSTANLDITMSVIGRDIMNTSTAILSNLVDTTIRILSVSENTSLQNSNDSFHSMANQSYEQVNQNASLRGSPIVQNQRNVAENQEIEERATSTRSSQSSIDTPEESNSRCKIM